MKKKIWKVSNALLSGILTLLGFSCAGSHERELDMYGSPSASYRVVGKVTDESGKPIEGIQVKVMRGMAPDYEVFDTVETDNQGNYATKQFEDMDLDYDGKIAFIDAEDNANDGFQNDTIFVNGLPRVQTEKGDDAFYSGAFEITANHQLKKK